MLKKILSSLFVALWLSGCATTQKDYVEIPYIIQNKIKSCETVISFSEQNIHVDVPSTYSEGDGLFMALVCEISRSHEQGKLEKFLPAVQQKVKEMGAGSIFKERVSQALKKTQWLGIQKIHFIEKAQKSTYEQMIQKTQSDVFMIVGLKGFFNNQFETFTGELLVEIYPVSKEICCLMKVGSPQKNPIYKRTLMFAESLPIPEEEKEKNAKQWEHNDGTLIKNAMRNIVKNLTEQLQEQLNRQRGQ